MRRLLTPYFAFLSVLHLRESLGLRGQWHIYLMKEHFEQSVNETEHLEYMESQAVIVIGSIVSFQTPVTHLLLDQRGLLLRQALALLTISPMK